MSLVGGNNQTEKLGITKTIYKALTQYNITLGLSLITNTVWPKRPINISYNPITNQFYEAMTSYGDKLRQIQMAAFNLHYLINTNSSGELTTIASNKKGKLTYYPIPFYKTDLELARTNNFNNAFQNQVFDSYQEILETDDNNESCTYMSMVQATIQFIDNKLCKEALVEYGIFAQKNTPAPDYVVLLQAGV